ncbi:MAG: XkdQ/YqbQ family protein [Bacillota bacterium]
MGTLVGKAEPDYVLYDDGKTYYLNQLVKSATWSGDISNGVRKLELSLINTNDGKLEMVPFNLGKMITFSNFDKEVFRGFIFSKTADSSGSVFLTCYDANIYLTKNTETRKFVNMTASEIIEQLCKDFKIPYGNIAKTDHVMPKLIFRDKSLWEMMITALTETSKATNKKYYIGNKGGKLEVYLRSEQITQYVIENGVNLLSTSYTQSIEDLVTQVKIIGGGGGDSIKISDDAEYIGVMPDGKVVTNEEEISQSSPDAKDIQYIGVIDSGKGTTVVTNDTNNVYAPGYDASSQSSETATGEFVYVKKNTELIDKYGIMQLSHYDTKLTSEEDVKKLADKLLKENGKVHDEANLDSFGIDTVVAGSSVYAIDTMTKLNGSFYVLTDSHSFEAGAHKMQVKLSYTDELPAIDYEDPEKEADAELTDEDLQIKYGDDVMTIIAKMCTQYGVPTWVASPIIQLESNFNPRADGDKQNGIYWSHGLLQLYRLHGDGRGYTPEQLYDPVTNLRIGLPPIAKAYQDAVKKYANYSGADKKWQIVQWTSSHSGHPSYTGIWSGSGSGYYPLVLKRHFDSGDKIAPYLNKIQPSKSSPSNGGNGGKSYLSGLPTVAVNGIKRTYKSDKAYQLAIASGCRITSGYRSPAHNARIGGSKSSDHLRGQAYDVVGTMSQMDAYCAAILREGGYKQVIWRNKDQRTGAYIGGHMDHVHVAWHS